MRIDSIMIGDRTRILVDRRDGVVAAVIGVATELMQTEIGIGLKSVAGMKRMASSSTRKI